MQIIVFIIKILSVLIDVLHKSCEIIVGFLNSRLSMICCLSDFLVGMYGRWYVFFFMELLILLSAEIYLSMIVLVVQLLFKNNNDYWQP